MPEAAAWGGLKCGLPHLLNYPPVPVRVIQGEIRPPGSRLDLSDVRYFLLQYLVYGIYILA